MSGNLEIKDRRRSAFFIVENHVLDLYAKVVGVTAWAVYTAICRLANEERDQEGTIRRKRRISVAGLATLLGINPRTVKRATRKLRGSNLIRVTKRQGVSLVEILAVEQLDFQEKLLSNGDTRVPSEPRPERTPASPPKGHGRPLRGDSHVPHSKTSLSKTSLSKRGDSSTGIKPPKHPPTGTHGFTQQDFDERDYRKLTRAIEQVKPSDASTGTHAAPSEYVTEVKLNPNCEKCHGKANWKKGDYCRCMKITEKPNPEYKKWLDGADRRWADQMRLAGASAGLLPHRVAQLLKQVYPKDPRVEMIG